MELKGIGVSKGRTKGIVRIVITQDDVVNFPKDCILVAKTTNPSMVVALYKSKAVITEIGGVNSHPAILSRELGIPCVVQVENVLQILRTGDEVELDGNTGIIKRS